MSQLRSGPTEAGSACRRRMAPVWVTIYQPHESSDRRKCLEFTGDLWRHYQEGGPVMHPITVCSLLSISCVIYKLLVFWRLRMDVPAFLGKLRNALLRGNLQEALSICELYRGPVATILKAGILKHGTSRVEIEKTMENAALHEIAFLERYLGLLSTIVSLAPLLGFFGTVVGMIEAFQVVSEMGLNQPSMVAHGIAVALLTTAWGLIVAFITLPCYNFLTSRVSRGVREIEMAANVLIETFDEMERMGTRA